MAHCIVEILYKRLCACRLSGAKRRKRGVGRLSECRLAKGLFSRHLLEHFPRDMPTR